MIKVSDKESYRKLFHEPMISYFSTLRLHSSNSPSFDINGQSVNLISVTIILTSKTLGSSFSKFSALENGLENCCSLSLFLSQNTSTTTYQLLILLSYTYTQTYTFLHDYYTVAICTSSHTHIECQ